MSRIDRDQYRVVRKTDSLGTQERLSIGVFGKNNERMTYKDIVKNYNIIHKRMSELYGKNDDVSITANVMTQYGVRTLKGYGRFDENDLDGINDYLLSKAVYNFGDKNGIQLRGDSMTVSIVYTPKKTKKKPPPKKKKKGKKKFVIRL